ncbi:hypothetical protein PSET11_00399 [Arthrobacter ulcerisalmonis]|uniref:EcsC protein family protein n=1 Tax=Arthrobacter ulcerisalmonis TaxID=2483813 RepID=A0A3P5WBK4_9MICC|nr:hypothetical protein [Arthrobacter ulcerisalmonis]VDC18601.1 hypothetical protein PSET11_00399 [Arthrobacter ulcerisalmonis]
MAKRSNPAVRIAQETAHSAVFDAEGKPKPGVHNVLLKAVEVQRPLVLAYLRRLRKRHPEATAAQLATFLERDYIRAVTGGGALVGATAVVPGIGTIASLGLSAAATVGFLETTALYATSLAELHGIRMTNPDKASTMVMAIMLGEEGTSLLSGLSSQAAGGAGISSSKSLGSILTKAMPGSGFGAVRNKIQKAFLKNLLRRQGTAFFGRALPFGIGAVVGGAGNLMMGRAVVSNAKEAFGPLPDTIPGELTATAAGSDQQPLEGKTLGS